MKFFVWIVNVFPFLSSKKRKKALALKQAESSDALDVNRDVKIDPRIESLKDSSDKLVKLNLIKNFFRNDILDKINDKTKEVHDLFRINEQLNIKKLEQFHYYYTDNLAGEHGMMTNLKKGKEETFSIINEKLKVANAKLKTLVSKEILDPAWITKNKNKYIDFLQFLLSNIYNNLTDKEKASKLSISQYGKDMSFDKVFSEELFYEISDEQWNLLELSSSATYYEYEAFKIEKKLMGKCHKNTFRLEFVAGFKLPSGNCAYLLNIKDTEDYFVFKPQNYSFYMTVFSKVHSLIDDNNTKAGKDKKKRTELEEERDKISAQISEIKNLKDEKIIETLQKYLTKISNEDFLGELVQVDLDRKYLEDILNTEKLSI